MRAATCLMLSVMALAACGSTPPRVASPDLAGTWVNAEGTSMTCEVTGLALIDPPGPKARPVACEYTFDGSSATFRSRPESKLCADEIGRYEVRLGDASFTLTPVGDACGDRARMLKGEWKRVGASRTAARD